MAETTDHELLSEFARNGSESAFAMLVTHHVNLVYSAALRFSGDAHQAEEITQALFVILARKAGGAQKQILINSRGRATSATSACANRPASFRPAPGACSRTCRCMGMISGP